MSGLDIIYNVYYVRHVIKIDVKNVRNLVAQYFLYNAAWYSAVKLSLSSSSSTSQVKSEWNKPKRIILSGRGQSEKAAYYEFNYSNMTF